MGRMRFRIVVVAVIGVAGLLLAGKYLLAWQHRANLDEQTKQCGANLKHIALALHNYHDAHRSFPPAYIADAEGNRLHSWRVLILPFLEQQELYDAYRFDEPWNGPNNRKLAARMPAIYACPADTDSPTHTTNYYAVVSSVTVWPEHLALRFRDIRDGTSSTMQLVESRDANVNWMDPRDLNLGQALEGINPKSSPSISSHHGEVANCAFCDAAVYELSQDLNEDVLVRMLTSNSGEPLRGLPDAVELTSLSGVGELCEVKPASQCRATSVSPYLTAPIKASENLVYCATFQLAWDQWRESLGVDAIEFEGPADFSTQMNASVFPPDSLDTKSYVAMAGDAEKGFEQQLQAELAKKFPKVIPPELSAKGVVTYAYLEKNLPFKIKFKDLRDPLVFRFADQEVSVDSFGFEKLLGTDTMTRQVTIHDYQSKDDFVIRLATRSEDIVLAKVAPEATLAETLAAVRRRIEASKGRYHRSYVEDRDTLIIPKMNFGIDRRFDEIVGQKIKGSGQFVGDARQIVRFMLNEAGARIVSESVGVAYFSDDPVKPEPKPPRDMRFDKPFLLYLQEDAESEPYLVVWVGSDELLVKEE